MNVRPFVYLAIPYLAAGAQCTNAAAAKSAVPRQQVMVCVSRFSAPTDAETFGMAELVAGRMFHSIGIDVKWHRGIEDCPKTRAGSIVATFPDAAPSGLGRAALAAAFPFEGIHLEIYEWRIPKRGQAYEAALAGYLLVHEITHLLEGFAGHTNSGIMKARWDAQDIEQMPFLQLQFSESDIARIKSGMQSRPARLAANQLDGDSAKLFMAVR